MRGALTWLPLWLVAAAAIAWAAERSVLVSPANEPTPSTPAAGITVPCTIVDVYDGDTLSVEVRVPIRVRLLACWAKELQKPGGEAARDHLRTMALGKRGMLHVPLEGMRRSDDVLTLGRLLAKVWIDGDSIDVSARMVQDGHATKDKQR